MAFCWMDRVWSGTTRSMSSSMMLPKPWQVGQAPNGLLNEKSRGSGASYAMPHGRQSKRSLKWCARTGRPSSPISMANAAPPPSRYAVSIESVRRVSRSSPPSIRSRSTITCSAPASPIAAGSTSSSVTARSPTSTRPKPLRRSASSVTRTGSPSGSGPAAAAPPTASAGTPSSSVPASSSALSRPASSSWPLPSISSSSLSASMSRS